MRCLALLLLALSNFSSATDLVYSPAPVDNPLKGLVPYLTAEGSERFPHSLKFQYLPLSQLMTGPDQFDWTALEQSLEECRQAGCQLVLRVYLEYPDNDTGVPEFLIKEGLSMVKWKADGSSNQTPDYEDANLRKALQQFIEAFGKKYDGDLRIGFITVGLLGMWGEWHTYPREELWASKETQQLVLDTFESAFSKTRCLLRYPAGNDHEGMTATVHRPFGYHDDSFAWATLITGDPEDDWFFQSLAKKAGALNTWKTQPIGGEIRPELWPTMFTSKRHPRNQGFDQCVAETHASWLLDSGMFDLRFPHTEDRTKRASRSVRKMGYEFHISSFHYDEGELSLTVENRGVAPFYYPWAVRASVFEGEKHIYSTERDDLDLPSLLPGTSASWTFPNLSAEARQQIKIMIPNPMENGKALRFANQEVIGDWLVLQKPDQK